MHILLMGREGQLAKAVQAYCTEQRDLCLTIWSRPTHDLTDPTLGAQIATLQPDVVINAAAWTQVDAAEVDPGAAFQVNALGPKYIAEGCRACGAKMVQVSTNEVFAGDPGYTYYEYDQPAPRSVYARSKLAGERAAQQTMDALFIVRTAWLFSPGGVNFPSKITAAADKHGALRVVADERGNPSYAPDVAAAILRLITTEHFGTYHIVNEGEASRYEFAQAVLHATGRKDVALTPISHTEWQRAADSPLHAVLMNQAAAALGIHLRPWREALHAYTLSTAVDENKNAPSSRVQNSQL